MYVDPFDELFKDCDVKWNIDNMLNLDFMENSIEGSSYDSDQFRLFSKSIE